MAYTVYYDTPGTILTYAQMQAALASLASANSWTYQTFGQSENLRDIDGVIINPTGYKRTTLITGGIHGNEKWTVRGVLDLLNYFDANPSAVNREMRYIVIPVLNPDGYTNNTRKNDNDYATDGLTPWPRSVDLNRNFPAGWGEDGSTDPANNFYMGPQAESEAEVLVYEGLLDSYAPDFVLDAHTPENAIYAEARYYPIRAASVASALSTNEFPALAFSINDTNGGTFGGYTWSTKNTEYYIFEAATTTTIHQEVNQYLCVALTLLASFNNPDHRTNIFKRDTTCVAHWRFNAGGTSGTLGFDDQLNINLTNYSTCTLNTTNFVEGDGSVLMSGASSHMARSDSALPSNFPLKYGSSNNKIGIVGWWAPTSLPASGAQMALASKYSSTNVNQRSWMLTLANVSGTYYIRLFVGHTSGTLAEEINMISFSPTVNVPFFIGFSYDIATKAWAIELYDETARIGGATGTSTNTMVLTEARFALGASYYNGTTVSGSLKYYGWIDEVAVFNDTLSTDKIAQIWAGEYGYVDYSSSGPSFHPSWARGSNQLMGAL